MFTCVLGRWVASTVILVPRANLSEGADLGDKECPFSGVSKCGSVWRKVPESDAGKVPESDAGRVPESDARRVRPDVTLCG